MRSNLLRFAIVACASALMISPVFALAGGAAAAAGDGLTRATVFITSLTPSGRNRAQVGNCTGVLIDRDLILTAGHCLSELGGPSLVMAQFFDRSNKVVGAIQVLSGALHPDYAGRATAEDPKPELLGADLAILKLASPAPADRKPIPLARDSVAASKGRSIVAGAGLRRPTDETSAGQLRIARVKAEVVTDGPTAVALGVAGGMICRGDSGGPVVSSGVLWGVVIAIVRKKSLCNSTVFMAVVDPGSRGFRTMLSRAKRSS